MRLSELRSVEEAAVYKAGLQAGTLRGDAAAVGLPERAVHRVIDGLLERVPRWLERLDELPFDPRRVHELGRAIRWRVDRLSL